MSLANVAVNIAYDESQSSWNYNSVLRVCCECVCVCLAVVYIIQSNRQCPLIQSVLREKLEAIKLHSYYVCVVHAQLY